VVSTLLQPSAMQDRAAQRLREDGRKLVALFSSSYAAPNDSDENPLRSGRDHAQEVGLCDFCVPPGKLPNARSGVTLDTLKLIRGLSVVFEYSQP
jgi:hypothetical protein